MATHTVSTSDILRSRADTNNPDCVEMRLRALPTPFATYCTAVPRWIAIAAAPARLC